MQDDKHHDNVRTNWKVDPGNTLSQLQWNFNNQWCCLLGGGWQGQSCVTIVSGSGENDATGQTIVVIGGVNESEHITNSNIVWDPYTLEWRNGPSLNDRGSDSMAVETGFIKRPNPCVL